MRRDIVALDAVNVDGDRRLRAGITKPVDLIKPRTGIATIARMTRLGANGMGSRGRCVPSEKGLIQGVFIDAVGTPGVMRVRLAELARAPDDREDRETPGRIGIDDVAGVAIGSGSALLGAEQQRFGDRTLE